MAVELTPADLAPFADIEPSKAAAMIEDVLALAELVAPCLSDPALAPGKARAAKAIVRGAVLRWNEAGEGAIVTQSAGPFSESVDSTVRRSGLLWPSEIEQLQAVCKTEEVPSGAWSIDTVPGSSVEHADVCSIAFGAGCSCGALIAGLPLYETG